MKRPLEKEGPREDLGKSDETQNESEEMISPPLREPSAQNGP